ncbi:condensation domain-containing protein [Mycobacterium sp. Z3061]|uniref:condensation domain-containing protein n=1 Tax=Mycobacterium sp. Z3061 TaxID=3073562 RepID=UPI00287805A7|nr:condensation domain-containing protein [Mycobacterium sp. Z3061]
MTQQTISLPLTKAQLGIWFDEQIRGPGPRWHLANFAVIHGEVDPVGVARAVQQAVQECDALRAVFVEHDGDVYQHIIPAGDINVQCEDLRCYADPVGEAYRRAALIRGQPMPLDQPLYRFALYQIAADTFYWFAAFHHLIGDGFSLMLLCSRVAAIYTALITNHPIPPTPLGSLHELITLEADYENSLDYHRDHTYWTAHLPQGGDTSPADSALASSDTLCRPMALDPGSVTRAEHLSRTLGIRQSAI